MKLRCSLLSAGLALTVFGWAGAASLHEQLDLATKDEDRLTQAELIQRILQAEPGDRALRERLVALWLEIEDYDQAEKAVQDETLVAPELRARVLARVLYTRDGKKDEAIALLTDFHQKMPDDLATTKRLAEYLAAARRWKTIAALLDQAPGVGNDVSLLLARAEAKRELADFDGALRDFVLADNLASENTEVVKRRPAFERLKLARQNIAAASELLTQDPQSLPGHLARAYWYLYSGLAGDRALADAKAAVTAEPEFASTIILDAYARKAAGQWTDADREKTRVDVSQALPEWSALDKVFREDTALKSKQRDTKLLSARAASLAALPQYWLAESDWDAVIALAPKDINARVERLTLIGQRKDYEAVAEAFREIQSVKVPPARLAAAASTVAAAAFADGRLEIALDFSNRAIKAQPTAQYYKQRAATLQRLNRGADAEADLVQAKTLTKKTSR